MEGAEWEGGVLRCSRLASVCTAEWEGGGVGGGGDRGAGPPRRLSNDQYYIHDYVNIICMIAYDYIHPWWGGSGPPGRARGDDCFYRFDYDFACFALIPPPAAARDVLRRRRMCWGKPCERRMALVPPAVAAKAFLFALVPPAVAASAFLFARVPPAVAASAFLFARVPPTALVPPTAAARACAHTTHGGGGRA